MSAIQSDLIRADCARVLSGAVERLAPLRGQCLTVTGGTGFMGKWIAESIAFLNDDFSFKTRLVLISEHAENFRSKMPHLAGRSEFSIIEKDVCALLELPQESEWVIHAAATPDSRVHVSDPVRTINVIVNGTRMVLNAASRLTQLRGFLNVSSGLIYGAQPWDLIGLPESYCGSLNCASLSACYSESKRLAETLCAAYRNEHHLSIKTARPFTFIGPYQHLDRPWAVNNFIRDCLRGGPIRILGDGETERGYMYGCDMAYWMLTILVHGKEGQAYNVGSPNGIKVRDLATKVAGHFPNPPKIEASAAHASKLLSSRLVADVTRATTELGLTLPTDLDTALRQTLIWNSNNAQG